MNLNASNIKSLTIEIHRKSKQGLSEVKVDKIKEAAAKVMPNAFITGSEAAARRSTVFHISTGAKSLDAILAGGIESREFVSEPMALAVWCILSFG